MFTRLHAIVIPLVLVGLLGFCFVKMQQTTDDVAQALRDTLLVEPGGEQGDPSRMTYQQLNRVMASTTYYRMGFYSGAFFLLVYMIITAMRPAPHQVQVTPRPAPAPPPQGQATPRPAPSPPHQGHPLPKQEQPVPQQAPSAPQRPIPDAVQLADDVSVEDEQPMLTVELPRPSGIVKRSNGRALGKERSG